MASLKVGSSLGRCFLRGSRVARSTLRSTKFPTAIGLPHRHFASVSGSLRDAVPNNGGETQPRPRLGGENPSRSARSVMFKLLRGRVLPQEIESLLKEADINVKSVSMNINVFRLRNEPYAIAELASEEEVPKAVNALRGKQLNQRKLVVCSLKPDFDWTPPKSKGKIRVSTEDMDASQAVRPLLERRRIVFKVRTPGWAPLDQKVRARQTQNEEVVASHLSKYGVEYIGSSQVIWGTRKNKEPKHLCYVDFETKEGAEEAIRVFHNTEIEGKLVQLEHSGMSRAKENILAKLDPKALKQLQDALIKRGREGDD